MLKDYHLTKPTKYGIVLLIVNKKENVTPKDSIKHPAPAPFSRKYPAMPDEFLKGTYPQMEWRTAIGQDSHRFVEEGTDEKPCVLGGVIFPESRGLLANSDGDVVLHALTNAVSGITCKNILGAPADKLCREGVTDSAAYLRLALDDLAAGGFAPVHVSFTIECLRPKINPRANAMRERIAALLGLTPSDVGITATTGEGLTAFGRGEGISVFCILTVKR